MTNSWLTMCKYLSLGLTLLNVGLVLLYSRGLNILIQPRTKQYTNRWNFHIPNLCNKPRYNELVEKISNFKCPNMYVIERFLKVIYVKCIQWYLCCECERVQDQWDLGPAIWEQDTIAGPSQPALVTQANLCSMTLNVLFTYFYRHAFWRSIIIDNNWLRN